MRALSYEPLSMCIRKSYIHCKKRLAVFPSPAGCHLPNCPWPGILNLFPTRKSFVGDIPAGDGKTANLFLQCMYDFLMHMLNGS